MGFFRNAASVFVTNLGNVGVGVGTSVVLARWLSVEDRGLYAVATAFVGIVVLLSSLGWMDASIYRLRRVRSDPARVAGAGVIAFLVLASMASVVCVVLEPWISSRFLNDAPSSIYFLALASFPFRILGNIFSAIARGLDRFYLMNAFRLGTNAGILLALVGVLVFGDGGLVYALTAVAVVRAVATLVFVVWVIAAHSGITLSVGRSEISESARFGLKSYMAGLAGEIHEQVDIFMISYLLSDPKQVAFYTVAVSVAGRLKIAPEAIGSALYPKLAGLAPKEAAEFVAYVSRQSIVIVAALVLAMALLAAWLVPFLFGRAYEASVGPLLILLPAMAFHTIYRVLTRWFTAVGRQGPNILTQALSLPVNLGLNLWWIPIFGIQGAALASLTSYGLEAVLQTAFFVRASGTRASEVLVPRPSDTRAWRASLQTLAQRLRRRS